jgi:hypothetical protein
MISQSIRRRFGYIATSVLSLSETHLDTTPKSGNKSLTVYYNGILLKDDLVSVSYEGQITSANYYKNSGTINIRWKENTNLNNSASGAVNVFYKGKQETFTITQDHDEMPNESDYWYRNVLRNTNTFSVPNELFVTGNWVSGKRYSNSGTYLASGSYERYREAYRKSGTLIHEILKSGNYSDTGTVTVEESCYTTEGVFSFEVKIESDNGGFETVYDVNDYIDYLSPWFRVNNGGTHSVRITKKDGVYVCYEYPSIILDDSLEFIPYDEFTRICFYICTNYCHQYAYEDFLDINPMLKLQFDSNDNFKFGFYS